ncbi:hypothetical protein SDC9_162953 [bioreactor metagenome]|uniref:Knr4/Smi1-like domain-containing protein n=1 Tax=bioreactor metagenome TaxID=1076179 RepID=A0A645FQG4_9ZZZZ
MFIIGDEDLCGDLIGVDTKNESLPIYLIPSDSDFETTCIASSFDNFVQIMIKLQELSVGRESPIEYAENQLSDDELNTFLVQVESTNPGCDMEFWKDLFECE